MRKKNGELIGNTFEDILMSTYGPNAKHFVALRVDQSMIGDQQILVLLDNLLAVYKTVGGRKFTLVQLPV